MNSSPSICRRISKTWGVYTWLSPEKLFSVFSRFSLYVPWPSQPSSRLIYLSWIFILWVVCEQIWTKKQIILGFWVWISKRKQVCLSVSHLCLSLSLNVPSFYLSPSPFSLRELTPHMPFTKGWLSLEPKELFKVLKTFLLQSQEPIK